MKDQNVESLAQKELAEQLKRGKPKDVKKLYELLVKNGDQNSAKASILDVLKDCYEAMPNGRMKLDAKKYGSLIEAQLKEIKTNLQPLYFRTGPKPTSFGASSKKQPVQIKPYKSNIKPERVATIDDLAYAFEEAMDDDMACAQFYVLNKDIFFAALDEDIAECRKQPVTLDELDDLEKRPFYYMNIIEDIAMALGNAAAADASFVAELENYVYEVTARPIDWNEGERGKYENLFDLLLDAVVSAGDEEKAQRITKAWKEKFPDTWRPEKATLFGLFGRKGDASKQKAWELSERILKENPVLKGNDAFMLEIMEDVYKWKGEADKVQTVQKLKKKYYE